MSVKPVVWMGASREAVRAFPDEARADAGYQLDRVQNGLEPSDWRPMPTVGAGVREIRIHTASEFRVLYVARFTAAVYVLHAFQKKTQHTSRQDIEIARQRYRALTAERLNRND